MTIEPDDLKAVGMVIYEKGFHIIESMIRRNVELMNDLERVTGNEFEDGVLKGTVTGRKMDLMLFDDLRKQLKTLKED